MKKIYFALMAITIGCYGYSQTLTEVLVPQYMQGIASGTTNANRVPFVYRATISGLTPNATYRYYNSVVNASDNATSAGAGNIIFVGASGTFTRSSNVGINTAGGYSTFVTDGTGSYTGWFITEPTGNSRYLSTNGTVLLRIMLNNGAGGTTIATRLTTTSPITLLPFGTTPSTGTGIYMSTNNNLTASNFVMLYDNKSASGRPIAGTFVENDGSDNSAANSYANFYSSNVNNISKTFGTLIPNTLPNGIQMIQEYDLTTGNATVNTTNDPTLWPSVGGGTVNTVNPSGGTTTVIGLDGGNNILPITISSFNATKTNEGNVVSWTTENAINFSYFEIERQTEGKGFTPIGNVSIDQSNKYTFTDNHPLPTTNYYRLKMVDKNGSFNYSKVAVIVNTGNGFAISGVYPTVTSGAITFDGFAASTNRFFCSVINLAGQQVLQQTCTVNQAFKQTIDLGPLSTGAYILKLSNGSSQSIFKVIKQ